MTKDTAELLRLAEPKRTIASLSRLERQWLRRRRCGFCETNCLSDRCYAMLGRHVLPIIEGVREKKEVIDLGPPCDMDERRAAWLRNYRPAIRALDPAKIAQEG